MRERGLKVFLSLLGGVAVVAGGVAVLTGAQLITGGATASASVDSELRFYAAWYTVAGAALIWAARRLGERWLVVAGVCAALLLGAAGRALSMASVGAPQRVYVALMVVEVALPAVIGPWLAVVRRR